jgi:outer membrane immunogenic protein
MFVKNFGGVLLAGAAFMTIPAYSQEERPFYRSDATVQAFGSFVKSTNSNGVDQSATNSGGVLASYRFFFNNHNGVEVNYGYALNTQNYAPNNSAVGVNSRSHEVSADYVFRFPRKHWSPFVLAGVGGLVFDPKDFAGASSQTRAAFVYGGGADIDLSKHVFIRPTTWPD